MCPPHSPTRITKNWILKLPGAFHCPKTSRIRFCAFSYSTGEPCGRSNQLITYFIVTLPKRWNYLSEPYGGNDVCSLLPWMSPEERPVEKHVRDPSEIRDPRRRIARDQHQIS